MNIIPNLPILKFPTPITRRTALIPARHPFLLPVDILRKPGVGRLDRLRIGQVVAAVPFLTGGAGDGEAAGGGGGGGTDAVGDGLGVGFVAGDGAGVAAGLKGGVEGGGVSDGEEGEGGEGEGLEMHCRVSW